MIVISSQQSTLLLLLQLATFQFEWLLISGFSVTSNGMQQQQQQPQGKTSSRNKHLDTDYQNAASQSITTLPPLLTTIVQQQQQPAAAASHPDDNYVDSGPKQQQSQHQFNKQRSDMMSEQEDQVPLATINNHSRNNLPLATSSMSSRPSQYVDVSALVGRNMSHSNSSLMSSTISPQQSSLLNGNGATGLSGKSRSGLPECATQQVCNAIFVRMNYTQKLCECSSNYNWKCSNNLDPQDGHTIELTRKFDKRIYTQIKTCEPLREVRACKSPTDWTLLALQSERSGKAHYVVVCKCPTWAQLEGPYTHNHPPYANIPGIRVYGMLCAHQTARSSAQTYATYNPALNIYPEFPWNEALSVLNTTNLASTLDSH